MTSFVDVVYSTYFLHINLLQHRGIETNGPGPQNEKIKHPSCCHWNVHIFIGHNLSKISQLEAYNSDYKHYFSCISETFLHSSVQERDKNIQTDRYNLLRADHLSNSKRGGVCIFYKETLGVRMVKSLSFSHSAELMSFFSIFPQWWTAE